MGFFIKGLVLGISIAAPVGPIGIICIRRTLMYGMASGFVSGLGAATVDAIYGCVGVFGVSIVSVFLSDYRIHLHFLGGVFLLYLGYNTFKAAPAKITGSVNKKGIVKAYLSTAGLTISNPITILSFAGIFAGLGVGINESDYFAAFFLLTGVFMGALLWWLFLNFLVDKLRHSFDEKLLKIINKICGFVLVAFGIFSLCSFFR